jgi:N-acetylmuramoyl-L-alanine amidase
MDNLPEPTNRPRAGSLLTTRPSRSTFIDPGHGRKDCK